jgi:hypothetical protein
MKGDFSRQTFDPLKHYAGVLMQQGRVQLDADWNEQEAIQRRRTQIEARDVIGRCGAPRDDAGFEITLAANKLTIGSGRFYVDGLLAECETAGLAYESQKDFLDAPDWQAALKEAGANYGLVYLDVWERHITPLEDRLLREVALGGPDTATRVKTISQVRVLPLVAVGDSALYRNLDAQRGDLQAKLADLVASGDDTTEVKAQLDMIEAQIGELEAKPPCDAPFDEWDALVADPDRRLNARSQPPTNVNGPCVVPPTAGYRRLENQLYRVEVHNAGPRATATFKWSRDNGTVVTTVEKISGKDVIVHDLGPDDDLGFADGQWVELTDDALDLAGAPGQLLQIDTITASQRRITLKAAPMQLAVGPNGVDPDRHPKLRRWDQKKGATATGVAMTAGWIALEDGVEVQFSSANFRSGDYWTIPARTASELEWPPFAIPNVAPEPQLPRGIRHHYCRLAFIAFDERKKEWSVVEDCRPIFPPLTECCDETADAIHVVDTNWTNDDLFSFATLLEGGLRVRFDGPPDPQSLTNDTFLVFVDFPHSLGEVATPNQSHRVYVRGLVGRDPGDPTVAVWRFAPLTVAPVAPTRGRGRTRKRAAAERAAADIPPLMAAAAQAQLSLRAHVLLRGSCIWRDRGYGGDDVRRLDGQALGRPEKRNDGSPRIGLEFPSGIGAPASDFESWFVVVQGDQPEVSFRIKQVSFLGADGTTSSAGDLAMPLPAGTNVVFKAGEQIQTVRVVFSEPVEVDSLAIGPAARVFIQVGGAGAVAKLMADIDMEDDLSLRLTLREPHVFQEGSFVLRAEGTNADGAPGGIVSVSGSPLDGDYDAKPGGDFALPFQAV